MMTEFKDLAYVLAAIHKEIASIGHNLTILPSRGHLPVTLRPTRCVASACQFSLHDTARPVGSERDGRARIGVGGLDRQFARAVKFDEDSATLVHSSARAVDVFDHNRNGRDTGTEPAQGKVDPLFDPPSQAVAHFQTGCANC